MANIFEAVRKIREAIYGKEIRDSIADGINAMNIETEANTKRQKEVEGRQSIIETKFDEQIKNMTLQDPSSAEIVASRVNNISGEKYNTLPDRLDKINSSLDEKANLISDLDSKKIDKTIVETELLEKRDKSTSIMMNDLHTEVKEAMTGGSVAVVGVGSVGEENLNYEMTKKNNFLKNVSIVDATHENIFNKNEIEKGVYYSYDDGTKRTLSGFNSSGLIGVVENTTYSINITTYQIAFYDENNTFVSGIKSNINQIPIPLGVKYMRFSLPDSRIDTTMLCVGNTLPSSYIAYAETDGKFKLNKNKYNIEEVEDLKTGMIDMDKSINDIHELVGRWVNLTMESYKAVNNISTHKRISNDGTIIDAPYPCDILYTAVTEGSRCNLIKEKVYTAQPTTYSVLYAFYSDVALTNLISMKKMSSSNIVSSFNEIVTVPTGAKYVAFTYLYNTGLESASKVTEYGFISISKLESDITKIEADIANISIQPLKTKNIAVLGDSIMMLQRTNGITTDGVVDQTKLDNQDWNSLQEILGAKIHNLGLGGATVYEKIDITEYPKPDGDSRSNCLSNEVRWLDRLVREGKAQIPDCVVIWIGTNGAGEPTSDNYNEIMALDYNTLADDELGKTYRRTFYGGLRYSLETLYRKYQYATIFVFSPIQTNPTNYRTYEKLTTTKNALEKMAKRYACIFVDALNEIGIVDLFENENKNGTDRFLGDGLHPNSKGKILYDNYTSKRLETLYFSKR